MKNRIGEEKQDTIRSHPLKRNSSQAVRTHTAHLSSTRTNVETKKKHHARLPAQVPASSVSKNPGGNSTLERKDAVSGQEDGKHREDTREGNRRHKRDLNRKRKTVQSSATCGSFEHVVPSHAWQNDVKSSVNNAWQISPFCHMLFVGAFVWM